MSQSPGPENASSAHVDSAPSLQPQRLEAGLEELEGIVRGLEQGNLSLDASLELFEKGIRLTEWCNRKLLEAEQRVEVLMKKADGSFERAPLSPDSPANS